MGIMSFLVRINVELVVLAKIKDCLLSLSGDETALERFEPRLFAGEDCENGEAE